MASLMGSYSAFLRRRPFAGNMATAAVLFATGDIIAQQLIEKKGKDHDLLRTGRIVLWGGGIFAPAVTVWFRTLERLPIKSKVGGTIARVGLDQFGFAPIILSGFFTVITLLEGKDMNAVKQKWTESFFPTLKANWSVWIPVQTVNMLVPPHLRLLFVNFVNIGWNSYLSMQAAGGNKEIKDIESSVKKEL